MKIAKRILAALVAVTVVLSCMVWIPKLDSVKAANLTGDSNYLFAYFTGTSIEGQTIHLAVSQDGLKYTALHNNDPVIVPSKGTGCVRDPYLWYNENDGYYYILATDLDFTDTGSDYSDNSESFIVWRSKDLVNWYDETMIDVKAILGRLGINNNNMQAVWAPQVLWDGSEFVVYFSLQCDGTSNGSWNPLTIVYLKTTNLLDESKYHEYGVIHNPGRHVIDADIIKKPNTNQYYMFYKDESASGGIQSIYYMISDNGPTGPYYAPNNANDGRGPQLFADIGQNLEGCNSFFDDNGNLLTFVDEYGYINPYTNQGEAHFHVSSSSDFSTFTTLPDSSHNINSLSPRHGSVVKITDEEYNRLLTYSSEITSSSFPETETLSDHLVARYFTTADYTYNAANGKNDLTLTDGAISTATDSDGDYYAYFNAAGAEINLANLISGDLNLKDGFTITFSASAPSSLGANARFFDISNNWSQRTNPAECYLHMSPVAESNGLYVGAYNGPVTTSSWTWASQGNNYNDGIMHEYIISFADGNMILYIDGKVAMKRDRYNMCAEYGDNFLTDNWIKEIGNSMMRIGKSEWADPLFTGAMQNLCIYDCSLSYYDVQKMQKTFDDQAGKTTIAKIAVPETVYMKPVNGASTVGQYYVNNRIHDGSNEVQLEASSTNTKGAVEFYIPGAKKFIIEVNTVTPGIGDIVLTEAGATTDTYENKEYDAGANGYFSYASCGLYINVTNGTTGITPGNTALAEWKITVIMKDGSQTTHYAYSTLYAPYLNPVGSAIRVEGRYYNNDKLYASSMAWISGVHGFTNDPAANYYARTDTMVPLLGPIGTGDNKNNPYQHWISESSGSNTLSTASFRYTNVAGSSGKLGAIGVYRSPVANLTIDTSRYTNFNQIPNLTVGLNYTDNENSSEQHWYVSDYTSGDMTYMTDYSKIDNRDNVNGQAANYYDKPGGTPFAGGQYANSDVNTGAEYNGAWNREVIKTGSSNRYIFKTGVYSYRSYKTWGITYQSVAYGVNYVLVNGTNVDKTQLRNLVLKATYFEESNYTTTSWNNYKTALQNAALALGNPANSDVSSKTALENAINALQTKVTLNANGGTINGAATTSFDVTVGTKSSVTCDLSAYVPVRDGYRFKGWGASDDAEAGAMTVTAGFMPTLYAVWEEIIYYTVVYDANGGTGSIASVKTEAGKSVTLPTSGFTKDGCIQLGWAKDAAATAPEYQLGQTVANLADSGTVTIYAVWKVYKPLVSDVVVIDFATPVVISPTDNDEELKSASYSLVGISADGENYASTLAGDYGNFAVNGNNITYTPAKTVDGIDAIYYHVSVNGSTYKESITVAPASNVLYEETFFNAVNSQNKNWSTVGTASNSTQSTSDEVYGYDSSYNKYSQYSNGSALEVKLTADQRTSKNETFTFSGTGLDLYGVCGHNTGVMIVSLRNNDTGKMAKSYIVDTFYNDTFGTLYQVPIVHEDGLDYANYTVQIVASWLPSMSGALSTASVETVSAKENVVLRDALAELDLEYVLDAEDVEVIWYDDNSVLNGGTGATAPAEGMLETAAVTELVNVIDSVRVYNPLNEEYQYYSEAEAGAMYYNVIDNLVSPAADGTITGNGKYFAYVAGKTDDLDIDLTTYNEVGPKDELYLTIAPSEERAIAFSINGFDKETMRVMISLRAALGVKPIVKIGSRQLDFIASNTEMYYDITDCVTVKDGVATVTIQNTTLGSLLAVGQIKLTSELLEPASLSTEFDLETARAMMLAPVQPVEPEVPVEPEDTTDPTEPEDTTDPTEPSTPEDTTDPSEPEDTTDTTDPSAPEDTTDTTNPSDSENNDEAVCWLVLFFRWLIGKFCIVFNAVKGILGL